MRVKINCLNRYAIYADGKGGKVDIKDVAPTFSTSTTYLIGDMVYYNGVLYRCSTAHSAGTWNSSHFTATTVNEEFGVRFYASTTPKTGGGEKTFVFDLSTIIGRNSMNLICINIGGALDSNGSLFIVASYIYSVNIVELGKTDNISYSYDSSTKALTVVMTDGYFGYRAMWHKL